MKVILKKSITSLGKAGDLINVNDGYARNYLIPKGMAIEADEKNIKAMEHEKKNILKKAQKEHDNAQDMADSLANVTLTFSRKAGDQGKIFGSVTAKDIEEALQEKGYKVDRKTIILNDHIKSLGESKVKIKLSAGVETELTINVIGE
ncbi:MAG TPA: 50S ribosomal protein L9 [Deltaproteobacteria bacterium]|nr:50S ribosomal protein L9 [Deltaproteobacteria bacterium]